MTTDSTRSGLGLLWAEIKRRRVVRFSLGYAATAFVALQAAQILFPAFGIGEGALRLLVVAVALAFLPAVLLAWLYDVTAEGIRRTAEDPSSTPYQHRLSRVAFALVTIGVTGGVTWYVLDQDVIQTLAGRQAYDPSEPIRSLAVLPLADFSAGGDQEYLAAGMHEELIARLSMLEDVRVVSRTTVMQYAGTTMTAPQIGRELGVDVLLEGSVNRSGERVRITMQVIHAASDSHIETLQFDREAGDVLALQTEVAQAVAREIGHEEDTFTFTSAEVIPAAQEAYFRGKHEYDRGTSEGYQAAIQYFEAAREADSSFAPALAGLAGARFLMGVADSQPDMVQLEQARAEAASALALDSGSLEVREVMDFIERSMPSLFAEAETGGAVETSEIRFLAPPPPVAQALEALDTTWVGASTSLGQRIEEQMRRKATGGPEDASLGRQAFEARQLMASGRYAEASRALEPLVSAAPDAAPAWEMLARSYIGSGDADAAAGAMRRWQSSGAEGAPDAESIDRLSDAVEDDGEEGYWTWRLEELMAAEGTGRPAPRTELAAAHAALGHDEEAVALLLVAVENGERGLLTLHTDPVWDDLRGDRTFRNVERQAQLLRFAPGMRPPAPRGRGGGR